MFQQKLQEVAEAPKSGGSSKKWRKLDQLGKKKKFSQSVQNKFQKKNIIVLPGLIDHQYAKFVAPYGILIDSAILKSMIFDDFVEIQWTDASYFSENLKSEAGQNRTKVISGNVRTDKSYFGKCTDGKSYFGKCTD